MQGDHLSAKVTLAGCAQYDSEYARDFLTLEGSRDVLCIDTHSDTYNIPLQSLLVEIMALPSVLACVLHDDKTHILLYIRLTLYFSFPMAISTNKDNSLLID